MKKSNVFEILKKLRMDKRPRQIIAGFDGFIDEVIHVVAIRNDKNNYQRMAKIKDFADKIAEASELSTNIELVPQMIKIGGNGVIMAEALISAGMEVNYFGALGNPDIDPLFLDFAQNCKSVVSVSQPGHTDALEFEDGKLMLGKLSQLKDISWENIINYFTVDDLIDLVAEIDLIAFTNWTMLPEMNDIMKGFYKLLRGLPRKPYVYIDLADPAKRSIEDIREVLSLISNLAMETNAVLGMNEKESKLIAECLSIDETDITSRASELRTHLDLYAAVIHPVKGAAASSKNETYWIDGPYTPTPVLTTGAGDNFNAGFCLGLLLDLSLKEALYTGVYTSGFYVRNAKSPDRNELCEFISNYNSG